MVPSHLYTFSLSMVLGAHAFLKPCIYQADKCGSTLISTYGYNLSELILAVNQTPSIPPLTADQILEVVFHCDDIYGNITGNAFCVNNCLASTNLTWDDECQLASGGSCPPVNGTTTVTVTVASTPTPLCFKKCQTWCFGATLSGMNTVFHPVPTPIWT